MNEAGYSVKQNKNAKSQVSECIKLLQTESKLPIQRARMRIKVSVPVAKKESLKEQILEGAEKVEVDETGQNDWEVVRDFQFPFFYDDHLTDFFFQTMLIDPSQVRVISDLLQKECKGQGRVETLTFAATAGA